MYLQFLFELYFVSVTFILYFYIMLLNKKINLRLNVNKVIQRCDLCLRKIRLQIIIDYKKSKSFKWFFCYRSLVYKNLKCQRNLTDLLVIINPLNSFKNFLTIPLSQVNQNYIL